MTNHTNAKYAFYYLLSLAALFFMSLSVGMIAFSIIDKSILDVLTTSYYNNDGQLKFAISALIIATPIFYVVSNLINKGLKKGELDKESGIRRWLTYFILLVSSLVLLGVFISVINNFLSGELTGRSILKALSMFVITGVIFSYYLYENKRENFSGKVIAMKAFFFGSLALVIAAFISAWFFVESPAMARNRRLDQNLINNIANIESAVNSYLSSQNKLPENLDQLKAEASSYLNSASLVDPETKKPIEYKKISVSEFQLCANFRTDNREQGSEVMYSSPSDKLHSTGYQCLKGVIFDGVKLQGLKSPAVIAQPVK
ncbi:MAG: DUF5671 domain-containing protein [Patescibacteria group bacterium]